MNKIRRNIRPRARCSFLCLRAGQRGHWLWVRERRSDSTNFDRHPLQAQGGALAMREALEEGLRYNYIYWENVYLHEILKKKPRFRVFLNVSRMFHGNFSSHRKNVRNLKAEISTISGHSFFFLFFGHE